MSADEANIESMSRAGGNNGDESASSSSTKEAASHKKEATQTSTAMSTAEATLNTPVEISFIKGMNIPDSDIEYRQWLQSMLQVARLPGGLPIEFRRKLWLALAERYLKRKNVDWEIEKIKWFSDNWRADDEELAIQIVKDLHRTGHSMLEGASGQLYQSKLKKILMGYSRWNPDVGYCQGFNMLGAIILQVMGKCEVDSMKVMIFLIEGILPSGYFSGGLMGLQADMAVFRELLGYKLPKLAKHLERLQSSTQEPSFEPPIINVFTIQWFLTLFCNCLPMSYVLRIWDLIMIEGSDILLRAALSIWKMMEDRILREVSTADDFYCKMESLSAELLSGTLIDANRLIHMISTLGPINNLQQLRQKHLTASLNDQKKLKMLYSSAEKESRLTARRGSQPQPRGQTDREKIAIDISVLRKQYDKLRERQKQAHIILSSAVTKQHQQQQNQQQQQQKPAGTSSVNKLLVGKNAIVSKGRRGPPKGAIPPARNQKSMKSIKSTPASQQQQKPEETTVHWKNIDEAKRRNSMTWKEINSERRRDELKKSSSASSLGSVGLKVDTSSPSKRRSDSSSYSEESDDNESSPSTSLCDEDGPGGDKISPKVRKKRTKDLQIDVQQLPTLNIIDEASPLASTSSANVRLSKDCFDGGSNSVSPNTRFYLDLPSNYGQGSNSQLTSISQLSPLPDLSNYFTAISPIKTPCGFFVLPEFNNFLMTTSDDDDEVVKFAVSDDGVSNEFFERCYEDNLTSSMIDKSPPQPQAAADNQRQSIYKTQKSLSMDERVGEESSEAEVEPATAINRSYSDGTFLETVDDFQKIIADNRRMLSKLTRTAATDDANRLAIVDEAKACSPTNLSDVEEEEIAAIDKSDENEADEMCSDIQDIGNIQVLLRASRERVVEEAEEEEEGEEMSSSKAAAALACRKANNNRGSRDETVGNSGTSSSNSSNVTTVPATAALENDTSEHVACCSETLDEKSMTMTTPRVENEASGAQATPILSSSLEKLACSEEENEKERRKTQIREEGEREEFSVKSEHCNPSAIAKALGKAVATRELESPKFNEIQLMVQKLKEEMENEMKNSEEVRKSESQAAEEGAKKELKEKVVEELKEKIDEKQQQKSTTTNGSNNNENSSSRSQSRESGCEITVEKMEPNGKLKNCDSVDRIEKITKKTTGKVVQIAIIVESEDDSHVTEIVTSPVEKIVEKIVEKKAESNGSSAKECEKSVEKKIDEENEKKTTPPNGDLEKLPSKAQQQQKIDNNSDDSSSVMTTTTTTVTTVKTTCENCQKRQKEESDSSTLDDCQQKKSAASAASSASSKASVEVTPPTSTSSSSQTVKNTTAKQQAAPVVVTHEEEEEEEPEEEYEEEAPPPPEVVKVKKVAENSKPTPTSVKHNQKEESEKVASVTRKRESSTDNKKKMREVVIAADCDDSSSRIVIKEKYLTSEEKSAVMELAELIKEREKEKIIELKRERSISPKTRSSRSSPTESIMSSASRHLYDHEPRSDVRRRDMYTSSDQQQHEHKSSRRVAARKSVSPLESPGTSPGKNLRDTLSSIQNTIKYLDHVCRDAKHDVSVSRTSREKKRTSQTPPRKYERVYDNIEKVCENDFKWMQSVSRYSPPPFEKDIVPSVSPMRMSSSSYDDDFYREPTTTRYSRPHRATTIDDDMRYEMAASPRYPDRRRYDRSLSPARTRYYDYDDAITPIAPSTYRSRRDISSSSLSPPRYSRARTPTFEEEDPCFVFKIRGLTTEQYLSAKSTLTSSRERLAASRERLNASRDRLNYSSSYADSREPYSSYSTKSPLGGSRERMNFSSSGNYSSLAGSRDRLNIGGSGPSRSTFSDSREFLYSKSPLGASRERLNASALSKSPYTSAERLYSSRSTTNNDYDRYYPITPINRPFSSSTDRINSSGNLKSALSTSRERLEATNKLSSSYLTTSREKLNPVGPDLSRAKSPANENFYTPKPPMMMGENLDAKYGGFNRSPTNPTMATSTIPSTHVSRAPTKSPVTVQSSASYLKAPVAEAAPPGTAVGVSPSKFVRFDMNHKSCSPVDYASTVDDQSSVATSYNDPAQFRPMPTGARKYDYLN